MIHKNIGFSGLGMIVGGGLGAAFGPVGWQAGMALGGAAGGLADSAIAGNKAEDLAEQQMQLARQQQAKWEQVFGPVQDSLARTINTLTPESYAASGILALEQQFEASGVRLRENVARRNLEGSGLEQDMAFRSELALAEGKAKVRSDAVGAVRDEKMDFLRLGLGQPGSDNRQEMGILRNQQVTAVNNAANIGQAAVSLIGQGANLIGSRTPAVPDTPIMPSSAPMTDLATGSLLDAGNFDFNFTNKNP